VWVLQTDFKKVIVNKAIQQETTPGLCEGQRRTPWTLAVIGCSLLCAA